MNITISAGGFQQAQKELEAYAQNVEEGAAAIITEYTRKIARAAKRRAPVDLGDLRDSVRSVVETEASRIVGQIRAGETLEDPDRAAFVEFGTGQFVQVPPGLEDYAMTFYRTGEGRTPAHPFLFPAVEAHRQDLINDLKRLVRTGKY